MDARSRDAVRQIFAACRQLTESEQRPFSPDGHLVGSLGEVLAADLLDLQLMPPSNEGFDAVDADGRNVEIKATTRDSASLSASGTKSERLVVLRLDEDGDPDIVFDGPSALAWDEAGKPQKNGQRSIRLNTLRKLAATILDDTGI